MSRKIDLFIIGAQKAGTTSLKNYLGEHPDMITHPGKEFSFFYDDAEYERGYELALKHYFNGEVPANKLLVCKQAHLYSSENAIKRLKEHNPDCKLIFIMRDPVRRTLSSYMMEKLYNRVKFEFDELSSLLNGSAKMHMEDWQYEAIVEFGIYHKYLEIVYKYFKPGQVQLILFEDFSKYPLLYCQKIFADFGINAEFQPRVRTVHNRTALPISRFYASFLKYFLVQENAIKSGIKKLMPSNTSAKLGEKLRDVNRSEKTKLKMSDETKVFLKTFFSPHNNKLKELTGLNLDAWN